MIKKLAHINFFSDCAKEMVDFYTDKLGMNIKFTLDDNEGNAFGWYIDCGDMSFIEIFDQPGAVKQWGGKVSELRHGSHYRHLCFEVENLAAFRNSLIEKGVEVSPVTMGMDNSYQAWIKDPDGNDIELMEYTPGSFQLVGRSQSR